MTRRLLPKQIYLVLFLIFCAPALAVGQSTADDASIDARADTPSLARQLGDFDPVIRQQAAEALARLAAVDQRKVVEGYHVQEKNKGVRLALDWAIYRMGKSEALFRIVRELDSSRNEQAIGYLAQLESPALLYPFLKEDSNAAKVNAGLLKALARIGDAETLKLIKPYLDSFQPYVAEAAENATDEIEMRLGTKDPEKPSRPRTVGRSNPPSP